MIDVIREVLNHQVNDAFQGPNGNCASVLEALDGVTATQAAWKPSPGRNSMWQIVNHLSETKEWSIRAIETSDPGASPRWQECTGDELAWAKEKQRLLERHERLKKAIEKMSGDQLLQQAPELGRCHLDLTLGIASAHEAFHAGQLQYLKLLSQDLGVS